MLFHNYFLFVDQKLNRACVVLLFLACWLEIKPILSVLSYLLQIVIKGQASNISDIFMTRTSLQTIKHEGKR